MRYRMQCGPIDRGFTEDVMKQVPELEVYRQSAESVAEAEEMGIPNIAMDFLNSLVFEDHIHMEDDIILCKNFKERVAEVMDEVGTEHLVTFFTTKRYGDGGWFDGGRFVFNQCFFIPKDVALGLDMYARNIWFKKNIDIRMIDILVQDYLRWSGRKLYAVVPSLVRHDCTHSYLFVGTSNRDCWRFIDDE